MRGLVYVGKRRLEAREVDAPTAAADDALVRVDSVGICGSDMHAFLGHDERRPPPLILGHEAAGTDENGRRVTINPLVVCGECAYCRSGRGNLCGRREILSMPPRAGAFAQWVVAPRRNLTAVPDSVPLWMAALCEPMACGWHAIRTAQRHSALPLRECSALVLGGGAIGVGAALVARRQGAAEVVIVERNAARRKMIEDTEGFKTVSDLSDLPGFSDADSKARPPPPPLVVDAVGLAATRADACRVVCPGGVIVHIGLAAADGGVDARRLTLQEVVFVGVYTYTAEDFAATARAIFAGELGDFRWVGAAALADGAAVFEAILDGAIAEPKVVLKPWD